MYLGTLPHWTLSCSFYQKLILMKYITSTLIVKELEPAGTSFLFCIFNFSLSGGLSAAYKYVLMLLILKTKQKSSSLPWPTATQLHFKANIFGKSCPQLLWPSHPYPDLHLWLNTNSTSLLARMWERGSCPSTAVSPALGTAPTTWLTQYIFIYE